jgi:pyrimidine operon attenuation protein / uracil phosphoribosyltransferase
MPEQIVDAQGVQTLIDGLAEALCRECGDATNVALIGIQRRGDALAYRLQQRLSEHFNVDLPCGTLDITLYRDDFDSLAEQPVVGQTHIPFALDEKAIILIDDVLFTGRTIRAALDELVDMGRPNRILLAVLVDRGWRELPIAADVVGKTVTTQREDDVQVHLAEVDVTDEVILIRDAGAQDG